MNSREEELKKYLARQERKKNRAAVAETKQYREPAPGGKTDPGSFITFFYLSNGKSRLVISIIVAAVLSIGVVVLFGKASVQQPLLGVAAIGAFIFVNTLFFTDVFSGFGKYRKFASGKSVPVIGWNHFIAGRSEGFWNSGDYAPVGISFDQDYQVSDLEKKAVAAFIQQWINDWGYRYKNKGKWTSGEPKEFNRVGAVRIEGHANISTGLPFMMDQFMNKLPDLLKLLTPGSLRVDIGTTGQDLSTRIDDADDREEERRTDQRYREMDRED